MRNYSKIWHNDLNVNKKLILLNLGRWFYVLFFGFLFWIVKASRFLYLAYYLILSILITQLEMSRLCVHSWMLKAIFYHRSKSAVKQIMHVQRFTFQVDKAILTLKKIAIHVSLSVLTLRNDVVSKCLPPFERLFSKNHGNEG